MRTQQLYKYRQKRQRVVFIALYNTTRLKRLRAHGTPEQKEKLRQKRARSRTKWAKTSIKRRYYHAKVVAKKRGLAFELELEQWLALLEKPCHYCNTSLDNIKLGVALDRKNNSLGYTTDNVLPCCQVCNSMRGDYVTVLEFEVMMTALLNFRSQLSDMTQD